LYKVFKPILDIPKNNKEIIADNESIKKYYEKFFDWLIEQYKTKNFLNLCIVGNSGSGKTVTTYFIAEEICKKIKESEPVYISNIKDLFSFIDLCKKTKTVNKSIFVFDEAYVASLEFEKYFYRFLNILRWFTTTRKALTFIIIHSRHQLSQNLKQNVDYYFIFDEKRNIKIFNNSVDLSEILRNLRSFQGRVKFEDGYLKSVSFSLPVSKIIDINEKVSTYQLESKYEMLEGIASKMLALASKMRMNLVS
jgi:nucleoside-triphosphatase THEP1